MSNQEKIYLTAQDIEALKKELQNLIVNERKEIIAEIKEARKQGDLSENAEYDAAKEKQSIIEDRIRQLKTNLKNATLIDHKSQKDLEAIKINSTVELLNLQTNQKFIVKIGTISQLNIEKKIISSSSPLARSILGCKTGDEPTIKGIRNPYKARILKVTY